MPQLQDCSWNHSCNSATKQPSTMTVLRLIILLIVLVILVIISCLNLKYIWKSSLTYPFTKKGRKTSKLKSCVNSATKPLLLDNFSFILSLIYILKVLLIDLNNGCRWYVDSDKLHENEIKARPWKCLHHLTARCQPFKWQRNVKGAETPRKMCQGQHPVTCFNQPSNKAMHCIVRYLAVSVGVLSSFCLVLV